MLEKDGVAAGYALAHPFRFGALPALDALLHALPAGADCLYLHDIAILADARGGGAARALVDILVNVARRKRPARWR